MDTFIHKVTKMRAVLETADIAIVALYFILVYVYVLLLMGTDRQRANVLKADCLGEET